MEAYKASAGRRREIALLMRTSDAFLEDLASRDITQNLRKYVVREQERRRQGGKISGGLAVTVRDLFDTVRGLLSRS